MRDKRLSGLAFELPPQSPEERDYRLMVLEAREDARELDTLDADRAADKWPARTRCHDFETTTAEDAAVFERDRAPDREVRISARRMSIDDVPDRTEL